MYNIVKLEASKYERICLLFMHILVDYSLKWTTQLTQVNCSKCLYQWNTGNGTTYILFRYQRATAEMYMLFRYQRTTAEMLQNVNEANKERTLIAAVSTETLKSTSA